MKTIAKTTLLLATAASLAGCASMGLFKDSNPEPAPLAPEPTVQAAPVGLTAESIHQLLSGKSWKWKSAAKAGVTLFASDGTSLVEVTGKGTTTGRWVAKDGELCESRAPAPFMPNGVPMTCLPMSQNPDGTYQVGGATFTLSS